MTYHLMSTMCTSAKTDRARLSLLRRLPTLPVLEVPRPRHEKARPAVRRVVERRFVFAGSAADERMQFMAMLTLRE